MIKEPIAMLQKLISTINKSISTIQTGSHRIVTKTLGSKIQVEWCFVSSFLVQLDVFILNRGAGFFAKESPVLTRTARVGARASRVVRVLRLVGGHRSRCIPDGSMCCCIQVIQAHPI